MKIGIIGAGAVGAAIARSLVQPGGLNPEIIIIDQTEARAHGLAEDMASAAILLSSATCRSGTYDALTGADLVIITAGVNEKAGGATDRNDPRGRRVLIPANAKVMLEVAPAIAAAASGAVILVVTDPPAPLAEVVRLFAPNNPVVSAGTVIDSLRFRCNIARELGVRVQDVQAQIIGEHGTSSVFVWSSATVAGTPVLELLAQKGNVDAARSRIESTVRFGNISVIEGIGASQHGIGAVVGRIAEHIVSDSHAVLTVASHVPEFETTISLPSIVGKAGVIRSFVPQISADERRALEDSARILREASEQARNAAAC